MSEVSVAFEKLNLPLIASEQEVKKAFKELSRVHHPDKEGGSTAKQTEINKAYEIALKVASTGTGLILSETENSLLAINKSLNIQIAQGKIDQFNKDYEKKSIKPFLKQRNVVYGLVILSTVIALFGKNILPLFSSIDKGTMSMVQAYFGGASFLLGILGLHFQSQATTSQHKIDDILNSLPNKSTCAGELANLLNYEDITEFKENNLLSKETKTSTYKKLSSSQKNKLIIIKALEHGLISKNDEEVISPSSVEVYKLNQIFKPSLFNKT